MLRFKKKNHWWICRLQCSLQTQNIEGVLYYIHKCPRQYNVITYNVLTDGIDRLIKTARTAAVLQQLLFASCFMLCATRISTNQSDEDWHHAPDSCTLEVFRVSPKREFAHFYLALFNNNFCSHFETKSIREFMNGNNSLTLGLYRRSKTGFGRGHRRQEQSRVLIACDHAQICYKLLYHYLGRVRMIDFGYGYGR